MSHEVELLFKVHEVLLALDERAAERVREAGCPRCGGRLHVSNYPRKARGLSAEGEAAGAYEKRLSLCCGRDGCRHRAIPAREILRELSPRELTGRPAAMEFNGSV